MRIFYFFYLFLILIIQIQPSFAQGVHSNECYGQSDLNFGVLIYNRYYKIYRSSGLGTRGLSALKDHLLSNKLDFPTRILYLNSVGYAPSAPHSWLGLKRLASESSKQIFYSTREKITSQSFYGAGSFATEERLISSTSEGREEYFPFEFLDGTEKDIYLTGENPVNHNLTPEEFSSDHGTTLLRNGDRMAFYQVLEEILTHDGPLLFHCQGGIHRTGMTALMLRYLQGGKWTDRNLLDESQRTILFNRYNIMPAETALISNHAELEYFLHNPINFRQSNLEAISAISEDARFKCLQYEFSLYLNHPSDDISCYNHLNSPELPIPLQVDKKAAWQRCAHLKIETEIENQLDKIIGEATSGITTSGQLETLKDKLRQVRSQVSEIDPVSLPRILEKLKKRISEAESLLVLNQDKKSILGWLFIP